MKITNLLENQKDKKKSLLLAHWTVSQSFLTKIQQRHTEGLSHSCSEPALPAQQVFRG